MNERNAELGVISIRQPKNIDITTLIGNKKNKDGFFCRGGDMAFTILIIGILFFLAHLFVALFERTKIPDVLLLILLGNSLKALVLYAVKEAAWQEIFLCFS